MSSILRLRVSRYPRRLTKQQAPPPHLLHPDWSKEQEDMFLRFASGTHRHLNASGLHCCITVDSDLDVFAYDTFVFVKTKGSVLIAILFHAAFNSCSNIVLTVFPQVENNVVQRETIYIINIVLMTLLALVLLLGNGALKETKRDQVPI